MSATDLVSPAADRIQARSMAERLSRDARVVALVDGTLNKGSLWGQGMLDAAEAALAPGLLSATFQRIDLNPLENPPPERWVAATLGGADGVVFAAGDCVTCTSRSVRDAIWAELAGHPAAMVCTGSMQDIVDQVCDTYGMPDLARFPVADSFFGRSREEIAVLTLPYVEQLTARLLAPADQS